MEDSTTAVSAPPSTPALPLILDGTFYKILAEDGLKVTGQCQHCNSRIMGLKTTTSNFNTHLKKMHPEQHRVYEEYKSHKGQTVKRRRTSHEPRSVIQYAVKPNREPSGFSAPASPQNGTTADQDPDVDQNHVDDDTLSQGNQSESPKRPSQSVGVAVPASVTRSLTTRRSNGSVPASSLPPSIKPRRKETDDAVFSFMIQSLSPPALVETPHFTGLVAALCANPRRVMSQATLESRINVQSLAKRTKIARSIESAEIICVTIDAWTVTSEPINTFVAITAHWIGPQGLNVNSGLLTCVRIQQDLTYNKLITAMYEVLSIYTIPVDKIGCIVTNNASSLLPTRIYQINPSDESSITAPSNGHLSFYNISAILSEAHTNDEVPPDFPSHYDCPTQTLISVLAMSTFETMSNPDHLTSYVFQSSIVKCQGLWGACANKEAGDRIQDVYGVEILIPNRSSWGSYLEAIDSLLASRDVLEGIFAYFDLPELESKEVEFLEEFVKTMEPLTEALNLLQNPSLDSYMGSFVPTILNVKGKLEGLLAQPLQYTKPLIQSLLVGLDGPFTDIVTLDERARPLILASMLHPLYKLSWVPEAQMEKLRGWYLEEAGNFGRAIDSNGNKKTEEVESVPEVSEIVIEFLEYLNAPPAPVESGQLDMFPNVKKLFVMFNTAVASSVHMEKVIDFSEVSWAPSSAILKNEMFEKMLILKCNQGLF